MAIFELTHGGYSRQDLLKMPYDRFYNILKETIDIQKKIETERSNGLSNSRD